MSGTPGTPFFSIVIPMFNRARLISRCIDSCLRQDFTSFEVVVVDDGSKDDSVREVAGYTDPRVRLFEQKCNKGQCSARNRGAREARGEWLIFLDSDDELTDGILSVLVQRMKEFPDVQKFILSLRTDPGGKILPEPRLTGETWDYEGFVRWIETLHGKRSEAMPCTRRDAFLDTPYPEGHCLEGIHELDFARKYTVRGLADIGRVYHLDADNNTHFVAAKRLLQIAPFFAQAASDTATRHRDAMQRLAPLTYRDALGTAALYHFLAGNRRDGLRFGVRYLMKRPTAIAAWAIPLLGLVGRRTLARVHERQHRRAALRAGVAGASA